ncbi:hypothetical protein [Mucilaginibacter gracilis]|uniref:hypothetical protein n=1 Tax=Mucilaginibacter gracilis TaxID=423350 RepID=UPI0013C37AFF|nr:hypothetical protein [Mucilaginibacter gracilis]
MKIKLNFVDLLNNKKPTSVFYYTGRLWFLVDDLFKRSEFHDVAILIDGVM